MSNNTQQGKKAGDAWKEHLNQFTELKKLWSEIPEPLNLLFSQQIDIFASKYPTQHPTPQEQPQGEGSCETHGHDIIPILGYENSIVGEQCRQCGIEIKEPQPQQPLDGLEEAWIKCSDRLPDILEEADWSANVLVWCDGRLEVMCRAWVDFDEESGYVWANCYGDINGDGQFDENYSPTHWMPLPSKPKSEWQKAQPVTGK